MSQVTIKRGKILVYRFYELGSEIDLVKVTTMMEQTKNTSRGRLDRPSKTALVMATAPLIINLEPIVLNIEGNLVTVALSARVWHFGGMALCFDIPIQAGMTWEELVKLAAWLERDQEIDLLARSKASTFQQEIKEAIPVLNDWATHEDYVIYFLQEVEGISEDPLQLFDKVDVSALMMAEPAGRLSDQVKTTIRDSVQQYTKDDLALIDWNSALVYEPSGSMDVPMVLEFANSQLLEMRFYDDLLDEKLDSLYKAVAGKKPGILSNAYSKHADEAAQIYLEIAEVVENVENSLKVVGDFYVATVFRAAARRFRFTDWQKSIDEKLNNLAEVSKLLHSHVAESRGHWLEIIIILLIAVEMVPLLKTILE